MKFKVGRQKGRLPCLKYLSSQSDSRNTCVTSMTPCGYTRPGKRMVPRLLEFFRQGQAEVVSKSRNEIHQTWGPPIRGALYSRRESWTSHT